MKASAAIRVFFLSILFLISSLFCVAQIITGKVIRVTDGDSITISDSQGKSIRVRLFGIDCPEVGQPFSKNATEHTKQLCEGKDVRVDVKHIDRYKRTVGVVYTPENIDLNLSLLTNGLAWHYRYFDQSVLYEQAENTAKLKKKGIWSSNNPVAPWDYRKNKKNKKKKK